MYNPTGVVQSPYGHREVPLRRPQSVFSKIHKHHLSYKQDNRGEDALNTCSSCEAGEPEAAAVAGSQEARLSEGCHLLGRSETAAAARYG